MGSDADLWVGNVRVAMFRNGVPDEFLSVFRDDMMQVVKVPAEDYYGDDIDEDAEEGSESAEFVDISRDLGGSLLYAALTPLQLKGVRSG